MRLVRLKIKNIASLKGEHVIDFKEVEGHSPLFAITGETGAGKSTILNSIGLSLYGEIYKKNVTQVDVVTLGEKEGQIELIFQVKGKHYLADWRAKVRKLNGELLKTPQIQRFLYELEGDDFDSPKTVTTVKTEELLHLDFDQFTKCIILNQGEFARFLSSSFTERKEILEKLYPGEMLESLSRELKTQLDSFQKQKDEIDIELKALQGDGPSGVDLEVQKKNLEKLLLEQDGYFKRVETLDFHYTSLVSYHQKYADNKKRVDLIRQDLARETTKYNTLLKESQTLGEKLASGQKEQEQELPRLQEFLKDEEKLKHLIASLNENSAKLKANESRLKEIEAKIQENKTKISSVEEKKTKLVSEFHLEIAPLRLNAAALESAFDLFQDREGITTELNLKQSSLDQLEVTGKEISQELTTLKEKKALLRPDAEKVHTELLTQKKNLQHEHDLRQRHLIQGEELKKQILQLQTQIEENHKKTSATLELIQTTKADLLPIETTLKLESLMSAVEVCLTHPQVDETGACPVCQTPVEKTKWNSLRLSLAQNDINELKKKFDLLNRKIIKSEEEVILGKEKTSTLDKEKEEKQKALNLILSTSQKELPTMEALEEEILKVQKEAWDLTTLTKEETKLNADINKVRTQYVQVKGELALLTKKLQDISQKFSELKFHDFELGELNKEKVQKIKEDLKLLQALNETQNLLDKVVQELTFLESNFKDLSGDTQKLKDNNNELTLAKDKITTILSKELGDKKASDLIQALNQKIRELTEAWNKHDQELKKQEASLKEFQGRIYSHDEQTRDIDLQFTKELHAIHEAAEANVESNEELLAILPKLHSFALDLNSPFELFMPIQDKLKELKLKFKDASNALRMDFATISERLGAWEKKQDRIVLQEMKRKDLQERISRLERLFEVLGKDELRTFVLSLVEENLIEQTNDELQKLCQGRYEIVHQSRRMRMTPEFYVLDKFREGGLRKVSTLSGGETFMVSLAMAIALAEMTRGQAEIDSLFIDEGFGTLDQDSLEDVLDMLAQIQTRGLMVGIISHIKSLTNAIPVNLVLNKKQDGTSTVNLVVN